MQVEKVKLGSCRVVLPSGSRDDEPPAQRRRGDGGEVPGCRSQGGPDAGVHAAVPQSLAHQQEGEQRLDGADACCSQRAPSRGGGAAVTGVETPMDDMINMWWF